MSNPQQTSLPIAKQILYNTVRVQCTRINNSKSTGTAFRTGLVVDGINVPFLVTNKHVVENLKTGECSFHVAEEKDGKLLPTNTMATFHFAPKHLIEHPDPAVDLCAIALASFLQYLTSYNHRLFNIGINNEDYYSSTKYPDITAMQEIVMIGYPIGLADEANQLPIVRRGIIATDPQQDYNGRKEFVIDAACFPGSSGSPVYIVDRGMQHIGSTFQSGDRIVLMGVLYAGPVHKITGEWKQTSIPTEKVPLQISKIPVNLGTIIKAERILEFQIPFRKILQNEGIL